MLTPQELSMVRCIADTLFPYVAGSQERLDAAIRCWRKSLASSRSLDDGQLARVLQLPVPDESLVYMTGRMEACLPPAQWTSIRWVLYLLSTGYGTWVLSAGYAWTPFDRLSPMDREQILRAWSQSSITPVRLLIRVLYKFLFSSFLGKSIGGGGGCDATERQPEHGGSTGGSSSSSSGSSTSSSSSNGSSSGNGSSGTSNTTSNTTNARNPLWDSMGYPGPGDATRPQVQSDDWFRSVSVEEAAGKSYDAIVVGSGAGGGVIADRLAEAGLRVLVCEKGNYVRPEDLSLLEEESYANMYERNGCVPSNDGSIVVLAGSTLGGGTAINWSASLQTPYYVREEWAKKFGLDHMLTSGFQASLDRVCDRIGATTKNLKHNVPNQTFLGGCQKLGYPVAEVPQNTGGDDHSCGWCHLGCPSDVKRGSHRTYLRDAAKNGADFLCGCFVEKIVRHKGKVIGVDVKMSGSAYACANASGGGGGGDDQRRSTIRIQTKIVVSAAGSLHTPALLLRSGFKNKHIGANLRLHPVLAAIGYFPEKRMDLHRGSILTTISTVADTSPDGQHYGCKLEIPTGHPMVAGLTLPLHVPSSSALRKPSSGGSNGEGDGQDLRKEDPACSSRAPILKYSNMMAIIVLQRDRDSVGSVALDKQGEPAVNFSLSTHDGRSLANGLARAYDVLLTSGATELFSSTDAEPFRLADHHPPTAADHHRPPTDDRRGTIADPHYRAFLKRTVVQEGIRAPYNCTLFSAHQMGSCRMASTSSWGACRPSGQLWECDDVWVCDGSLFPTASGVNPMVTILAVCDGVADHCVRYLKERIVPRARM